VATNKRGGDDAQRTPPPPKKQSTFNERGKNGLFDIFAVTLLG